MGDFAEPTAAVRAALDELANLLPYRGPREAPGWDVTTATFSPVWNRLARALGESAGAIHNPRPGQGLVSMWLRAVATHAAQVERAVQGSPSGWHDVLRRGDPHLVWLTDQGQRTGVQLESGGFAGSGRIGRLLTPHASPLARLRELALEWKARFERAPREPHDFERVEIVDAWAPWGRKRDEYILHAGVLILEAVDAMDIDIDRWSDAEFARLVLFSIEVPENLSQKLLDEQSPRGLLALVDRLAPSADADRAGDIEPAAGEATSAANAEKPSYPSPQHYARDGWIYENIQSHTCHSLSLALSQEARIQKWQIISSRNGLKKAVKRYADYHDLPPRGFRSKTVTR